VVHAPLILVPTTASGSIPTITTIVIIPMLIVMLDFPISNLSEDLPVLSASLVLSTPRRLDLKLLSASSTLAVVLAAALSLPLTLAASPFFVVRRVMSVLADMLVSLTAPIPLNTVALLVRRSALVVVWVEVLARAVSALVTRDTRVRIVPSTLNSSLIKGEKQFLMMEC